MININKIAVSNHLALIWVPGHSGIQGNERADELANTGAVVEYIGPSPVPLIPLSFVKFKTKEYMDDRPVNPQMEIYPKVQRH